MRGISPQANRATNSPTKQPRAVGHNLSLSQRRSQSFSHFRQGSARGPARRGFTIVELLIVVVVIAILAAITLVAYNGITAQAYDARMSAESSKIRKAWELHQGEHSAGTVFPENTNTSSIIDALNLQPIKSHAVIIEDTEALNDLFMNPPSNYDKQKIYITAASQGGNYWLAYSYWLHSEGSWQNHHLTAGGESQFWTSSSPFNLSDGGGNEGGPEIPMVKLLSSDGVASDFFGSSIDISGNIAVIGAPMSGGRGSAYIFTRSDDTWSQQAKLTANDGVAGDYFGISVALSGETAVIGAYRPDSTYGQSTRGSAYVFTRNGSTWSQQAKLTINNGVANDRFGDTVAISGDTVIIGSSARSDCCTYTGAAYIFTRSGSTWSEQAKLTASDVAANQWFGASVALTGDTAVVGATGEGAAYIFTRNGSTWSEQAKLTASDSGGHTRFGTSVALSGNTVIIGAREMDNRRGAAYVFTRSGGNWSEQAKLAVSDGADYDEFGTSVALSGDTAIIGAHGNENGHGAAYTFTRSGSSWTQQAKLTARVGAAFGSLGNSVALSGNVALIGAPGDDNSRGSIFYFENQN